MPWIVAGLFAVGLGWLFFEKDAQARVRPIDVKGLDNPPKKPGGTDVLKPSPTATPSAPSATPAKPSAANPEPPRPPVTVIPPPVLPQPELHPSVTIPPVEVVGKAKAWDPGPMPKLPAIPPAGKQKTAAHTTAQKQLVNWLKQAGFDELKFLPVLDGRHYTEKDINGIIDARTQAVTWLFQRYANDILVAQPRLTEDGLFGTATYKALAGY